MVAVGWSYGGTVISVAAAGEPSVRHLVYVSDVPSPPQTESAGWEWMFQDPHVHRVDGNAYVLDNDWWLDEEAGRTFTEEVRKHLRRNPRRPASRAVTEPQKEAAWQYTSTTVIIGRQDPLLTDAERSWAAENIDDVRVLDTDHFVIFRAPDLVSDAVIEILDDLPGSSPRPGRW